MDTKTLADQLARSGTAAHKVELVRSAGSTSEAIEQLEKHGSSRTARRARQLLEMEQETRKPDEAEGNHGGNPEAVDKRKPGGRGRTT